jgi:hypothetical protein
MKPLLRLCLLAVIALPVAGVAAVWMSFQDAPLIASGFGDEIYLPTI